MPNPLIGLAGRPFLFWLTAYFAGQGFRSFTYSTGYKAEQIARRCETTPIAGLSQQVREELGRLGTGGGLLNCLDVAGEWLVVSDGDSLCLGGIEALLALAVSGDWDGGLMGRRVADTARYGSLDVAADGALAGFREKVSGQDLINGGVYLFRKQTLERFDWPPACSLEQDMLPCMIADVAGFCVIDVGEAPFIDIGTPESIREADAFVSAHADQFRFAT